MQENIHGEDSSLHAGYVTECKLFDNVNEGGAGCIVLTCKLLQLHWEMYDFTHKVIQL